jgi:hypothetical protein
MTGLAEGVGYGVWEASRALDIFFHWNSGVTDATLMETIPALVDVLVAVEEGDSVQSIALRCVWPKPKTRKAA